MELQNTVSLDEFNVQFYNWNIKGEKRGNGTKFFLEN